MHSFDDEDLTPQDPAPGYLDPLFDSLEPPLAPGSWERLQARKRRRRVVLWWWFPLAALLLGAGGWGISRLYTGEGARVGSAAPAVASKAGSIAEGQRETPPSAAGTEDLSQNTAAPASPPAPAPEKAAATDVEAQAGEEAALEHTYPGKEIASSNRTAPAHTPGDRQVTASEESVSAPASLPASRKKEREAVDNRANLEGMFSRVSKKYPSTQAAKTAKARVSKEPLRSTGMSNSPVNARRADLSNEEAMDKPTAQAEPRPAMPEIRQVDSTLPARPNQPALAVKDSVPDTASVGVHTPLPVTDSVRADSSRPKQVAGAIRWLVDLSVYDARYNASAPVPALEGRSVPALSRVRPGLGIGLEFGPVLPVTRRFGLQPVIGFTALHQTVELAALPGEAASVHLTQAADGTIQGAPVVSGTGDTQASRWLLIPQAGLHAHLAVTDRLGLQGGAQVVLCYAGGRATEAQRPLAQLPQFSAGVRYALSTHLGLQAQIRWLTLRRGALPGSADSQAGLTFFGLGLQYGW